MSKSLSLQATRELLGSVKIPAAPAVFLELQELMQRDEPDIGAVSATISRDVGLAALVLKTVNSSFFGLRSEVSSIRQATTLLGLRNIRNIVAGLALRRAMEEAGGAAPDNYWESPANVGMVAAMLARRFPGVTPDLAYMLGLFHNVGVPLMMQRFDDYLDFTRAGGLAGPALIAAEDARYNTNHAVVGYFVCKSWKIPGGIAELIRHHHDVDTALSDAGGLADADRTLLGVLKMAEYVDNRYWGLADESEWTLCVDAVLGRVGMSDTDFAEVVEDMLEMLSQL